MPKVPSVWWGLLLRIPAFFLVYVLFVDDLHEPELVTGAVTAVGAAIFSQIILASRQTLRVRPIMLRRLPAALLLLVTDTARVTWALFQVLALRRSVQGHLRVARYRATSEEDPEDFGRRALTQWAASLGANRYVIGIDNDHGLLIVHELVTASSPLDPLELG